MKCTEEFYPFVVNAEQATAIFNALSAAGYGDLAADVAAKAKRSETDQMFVNAILELESDDIQIDDNPVVSRSEEGAFVMTWHWVSNSDAGIARV